MKNATILLNILVICLAFWGCSSSASNDSGYKPNLEIRGVHCFNNLKAAQLSSENSGKSLFVIFDSPVAGCCKTSSELIFSYLNENATIRDNYEIVYLQLDNKTKIKSNRVLKNDNKTKKVSTVGEDNTFLMMKLFRQTSSYLYVIMDKDLEILKEPVGFFSDEKSVRTFLEQ